MGVLGLDPQPPAQTCTALFSGRSCMSSGGLLSAHGSPWALRGLRGSGAARGRNPGPEESSQGPSIPKELRRPLLRRDSSANTLPAPQGLDIWQGEQLKRGHGGPLASASQPQGEGPLPH